MLVTDVVERRRRKYSRTARKGPRPLSTRWRRQRWRRWRRLCGDWCVRAHHPDLHVAAPSSCSRLVLVSDEKNERKVNYKEKRSRPITSPLRTQIHAHKHASVPGGWGPPRLYSGTTHLIPSMSPAIPRPSHLSSMPLPPAPQTRARHTAYRETPEAHCVADAGQGSPHPSWTLRGVHRPRHRRPERAAAAAPWAPRGNRLNLLRNPRSIRRPPPSAAADFACSPFVSGHVRHRGAPAPPRTIAALCTR